MRSKSGTYPLCIAFLGCMLTACGGGSDAPSSALSNATNNPAPTPAPVTTPVTPPATTVPPTTVTPTPTPAVPGSKKWVFDTKGLSGFFSPALGADGTIYIGANNAPLNQVTGKLYAVKPDGSEKWEYPAGSASIGGISSSAAVAADGTVYMGSYDQKLYALNADGTLKWTFQSTGVVSSTPALGADGSVYVAAANVVYALDAVSGASKWSVKLGGTVRSSPALSAAGVLYVGSDDGHLTALAMADGSKKWDHDFAADGYFNRDAAGNLRTPSKNPAVSSLPSIIQVDSSPAIGADGTVYVGVDGYAGPFYQSLPVGLVCALDPASGALKWKYGTNDWVQASPVIGADGTVYVGANGSDSVFYALNPQTGAAAWGYSVGGGVTDASLAADGTVYLGLGNNALTALTAPAAGSSDSVSLSYLNYGQAQEHGGLTTLKAGKALWSFVIPPASPLNPSTVGASPAIAADGTIYIGSEEGHLYAINGKAALATSAWPKFHGGAANSGRSVQ
ncbi:PQQ-binding-like beta-propeller repeat protein [Collimonas pratensis]|uniref:PQQ enzyme repeat family protein n=1 Tax=Collimonas pratensis TaxID=279113 RepID=A0A127Q2H1_9BURK|nr:PQQ-binding-like beta-propeller repeat protein [Collimonas pratensis]AMP04280.1 PQQ enzyme repeat family protein [Collimonas pratensis]